MQPELVFPLNKNILIANYSKNTVHWRIISITECRLTIAEFKGLRNEITVYHIVERTISSDTVYTYVGMDRKGVKEKYHVLLTQDLLSQNDLAFEFFF